MNEFFPQNQTITHNISVKKHSQYEKQSVPKTHNEKSFLENSLTSPFVKKWAFSNESFPINVMLLTAFILYCHEEADFGEKRLFDTRNRKGASGGYGLTGTNTLLCDVIPFTDNVTVTTLLVSKNTFIP